MEHSKVVLFLYKQNPLFENQLDHIAATLMNDVVTEGIKDKLAKIFDLGIEAACAEIKNCSYCFLYLVVVGMIHQKILGTMLMKCFGRLSHFHTFIKTLVDGRSRNKAAGQHPARQMEQMIDTKIDAVMGWKDENVIKAAPSPMGSFSKSLNIDQNA